MKGAKTNFFELMEKRKALASMKRSNRFRYCKNIRIYSVYMMRARCLISIVFFPSIHWSTGDGEEQENSGEVECYLGVGYTDDPHYKCCVPQCCKYTHALCERDCCKGKGEDDKGYCSVHVAREAHRYTSDDFLPSLPPETIVVVL